LSCPVSSGAKLSGEKRCRIASFLPSSTEILYEVGAGDQITGVTHECNYPDDAMSKPRVINSAFDPSNMTSREIDNAIVGLMKTGGDIYTVDEKALKEARPDLIIAQGVCEVCAPFTKEIDHAKSVLGYDPDVLVLDPHDLDDILTSIIDVAKRVGRLDEGTKVIESLLNRINDIKRRVGERRTKSNDFTNSKKRDDPNIVCIEWIDPFFSAGHWIPQMVDIAGGYNGLSTRGQPSRRISLEQISEFNPDKIILMPCGFDVDRTLREAKLLDNLSIWASLEAVQRNEVYAVNANAYFSKPGPRIVTGLAILAKIINPVTFADVDLPPNSFTKVINS
ncbi:MAG TPA: cobalamin-binding protein, partial [Nitrososphaeraceae archaeon]|nr:cobalamin-binding protein [Nitrososphaeraceae archaeon]